MNQADEERFVKQREAIEMLTEILKINPKDVEELNNILKIDPTNVKVLNRGIALYELGKNQEALEVFDKVLEFDKKNALALNNKGAVLRKLGRYQDALNIERIEAFISTPKKITENDKKNILHHPPSDSESKQKMEDARILARQNASIFEKIGAFLFVGFIIFAVLYGIGSSWFGEKPVSDCKRTTKEVQTITKLDGDVDSVKTELVYGCEYPDGSFYEYPD